MDWNDAGYESANIKIEPNQLPLDAMWKTGQIIQQRYDQGAENLTKTEEALRQLKSSSNPVDRELADQISASYQESIKNITDRGDFHNFNHQINKLATTATADFGALSARNQEIQKRIALIDMNPNITDPKIKADEKAFYLAGLTKATYDDKQRTFMGLEVNNPNIVNDYDYDKFFMEMGSKFRADGEDNTKVTTNYYAPGVKLPDGSISIGGMYKKSSQNAWERVNREELISGLTKLAANNPELQATLARDKRIYGEDITNTKFNNSLIAAVDANDAHKTTTKNSYELDPTSTAAFLKLQKVANANNNNQFYSSTTESNINPDLTNLQKIFAWKGGVSSKHKTYAKEGDSPLISGKLKPEIRHQISFFLNGLNKNLHILAKSEDPTKRELYRKIAGTGNTNIWGIINTINNGKELTYEQELRLNDILNTEGVTVPVAAASYTMNSDSFKALGRLNDQTTAMNANGDVDMEKTIENLNLNSFGNKEGLVFDAVGDLTTLGGVSNSLVVVNPKTGETEFLNEYLEDKKDNLKSKKVTIKGLVNPHANIYANPNDSQMDLSFIGNGYTMNFGDGDVYVGNPADLGNVNSQIATIASYTRGYAAMTEKQIPLLNYKLGIPADAIVKIGNDGNTTIIEYNGKKQNFTEEQLLQ